MLDDRTVTPDPQLAPFVLWSWDDNCTGWQALLGDAAGGPDTPVSAAPARVADPAGLPPAYIEVGQLDIFRDEDLTYALRLGQAGSRSSSTSTPASRTNSTSLPSTPPPPGASWPTASAPSPPCDHAANGTSSLPRPRRHPRCLRRSSCTSSRWPPAKPPRPTTLFAGSRTGSDPDWDSPACAKEEPDEPDRAVRRNDRLPRHGPGPHERAAARLLMDASLWNDVIPTCPPITGAWHRRCPWRHTTTRCAPTPTCRCPGSPSWSPSSSTASTCATSPSSATTPAARPTPRLRRSGPARADRSRLLRRVRQLPARSHRQNAGADRQDPDRAVWPVHAPHALAAGATAADRVRVADQARRRRHPPMDPTGPPPARDPPRHRPSPARGCGRERHARGGREPRGLPPPRAGGRANEDGVMPPDHGRCLTELLLQGRLVEIPDTDTLIPWTSPDGSRGSCVTSHGHRPATGQHGSRHDERSRRSALPGGVPERTPAGTVRASPM
jgi:alpha/beta hydrolase fold